MSTASASVNRRLPASWRRYLSEREKTIRATRSIEASVAALRFEGRLNSTGKITDIRGRFRRLLTEYRRQIRLEERVVFAFLEKHVPRFCAATALIRGEHRVLLIELDAIWRNLLHLCRKRPEAKEWYAMLSDLSERCTYLSCLAAYHIRTENQLIGDFLRKDLRDAERQLLARRLADAFN